MCWMIFLFLTFIFFVEMGLSFFESVCEWLQQAIWTVIGPYSDGNYIMLLLRKKSLKLLLVPVLTLLFIFYICLYFVQIILYYLKKPVPSQIAHEINFDILLKKST